MGWEPDGTPDKRPPAPSVSQRPLTLILRKHPGPYRGIEPDLWDENAYAVVDPDLNKHVGRIYPETIHGEPRWL